MSSNTEKSFRDKWHKNQNMFFDTTLDPNSDINQWILNRNGFSNVSEFADFLHTKKRILDGGCGNGRVTKLMRLNSDTENTEVVGIDLVAHEVARENLKDDDNVAFYQKDLTQDLTDLGKFDFIYSQEVLHHTSDPRLSFNNLVQLLDDNGVLAIYVYKKKAPVREFTDDFVRDGIINMDYDQAMDVSNAITVLGKALHDLNIKVTVPDIELLGIKGGEYDLQRFIYHHFMKCYWNDQITFEENAVINYDWYHPQECSRHTTEEVREWYESQGLEVTHVYEDHYGITMHGVKKA